MKTLPIAALCFTLLGGCATTRGAKTGAVAGVVTVVAGVAIGAIAYKQADQRFEPELSAIGYGGPVVAVGGVLLVGSLLNLIILDVTRGPPSRQARRAPPPAAGPPSLVALAPRGRVFRCTLLEIAASRGDAPLVDVGLEPLRPTLARAPYASWNRFRVLTKMEQHLTADRPEVLPLEMGAASVTATALDASRIRIAVAIDDAIGQRHLYPPATVAGGDYTIHGAIQVGPRVHTLALACD